MTLHEVEQVEVGSAYVMRDHFGNTEYIVVREYMVNDEPHLVFGPGGLNGNSSISYYQERGAKFYGPIDLQPAQGSAAGGEQ